MNLHDRPITVVQPQDTKVVSLGSLFHVKEPSINYDLIRRYWNMVVTNKKQPQSRKKGAGLSRCAKSPGTNKGESRQKYSIISGSKKEKSNAPNHRKGRRALYYTKDRTLKMNKKQKKIAIKSMLYSVLLHRDLYVIEPKTYTTKMFLSTLKQQCSEKLKNYLIEPRDRKRVKSGPVILLNQSYEKLLRNFPKVLNIRTSTDFFGLYNGFRCRHSFIFEVDLLREFIKTHEL